MSGGRFLKRCDNEWGGWIGVSDEVAQDKVSHGFRTKTRRMNSALLRKRQKEVDGEADFIVSGGA